MRFGVDYWNDLRGAKPFPRRQDINPRRIGRALSIMVLTEVVGFGADFKLRIVGDEVRRAYPVKLSGRLLSEIEKELPKPGKKWRELYEHVFGTGCPLAMQVHVGLDGPDVNFSYAEAVCLPFGTSESGVDYLVTFTARVLEIAEEGHVAGMFGNG